MVILRDSQLERQDFVDNAIYGLLRDVNPSRQDVEWNIEIIGDIRDRICYWLVERLELTDEMTFYPYIDNG